uniref:Uncharacterized protein n=1 Tax=Sphaerodactylus townsendi TaxID=933632 RepID=A0ACB8FPX1_9SAUR
MKCALLGLAQSPSKRGAAEWPRSEREEDRPARSARSPSRCLPNMLRKVNPILAPRARQRGIPGSSRFPLGSDCNLEVALSREAAGGTIDKKFHDNDDQLNTLYGVLS